jgi:hypothetical protein
MPRDHDPARGEEGGSGGETPEPQGIFHKGTWITWTYISDINGFATLLPPIPTRTIVGAGLANCHLDKRQRACLAADVIDGLVTFIPSQKQLADLLGVSVPYINVARRLSAGKRTAILRGWDSTSFTDLVCPQQRQLLAPNCASITNLQLEHVIRAVGVDRALEAAVAVERT